MNIGIARKAIQTVCGGLDLTNILLQMIHQVGQVHRISLECQPDHIKFIVTHRGQNAKESVHLMLKQPIFRILSGMGIKGMSKAELLGDNTLQVETGLKWTIPSALELVPVRYAHLCNRAMWYVVCNAPMTISIMADKNRCCLWEYNNFPEAIADILPPSATAPAFGRETTVCYKEIGVVSSLVINGAVLREPPMGHCNVTMFMDGLWCRGGNLYDALDRWSKANNVSLILSAIGNYTAAHPLGQDGIRPKISDEHVVGTIIRYFEDVHSQLRAVEQLNEA